MIDRRTFLKLSAGALVLTAAGALTGCGDTVIDKTSGVAKIGDVTFICATPFLGGGLGDGIVRQLTYWTQFTIQNNSAEKVVIKPRSGCRGNAAVQTERTDRRAGADGRLQWLAGVLSGNKENGVGKEQHRHL